MKRKVLISVGILSICLIASACGSSTTDMEQETETIAVVETAETLETETEDIEISTEQVEESTEETEPTEVVEETTEIVEEETIAETEIPFEKVEPLSEKDLDFPFLGYDTYIDYIAAGNTGSVYMVADNAKMIETGEFVDEGDVVESTVRGIKLGDNIEKILEVYGPADKYDTYGRDDFSHDGREDVDQYLYFLKIDSTKDYFYSFRFVTDQYGDLIGFILEPLAMKYWAE